MILLDSNVIVGTWTATTLSMRWPSPSSRKSLKMPDALILATADLHEEVGTVLCADGEWPEVKGLSCKVELLKPSPPKDKDPKDPA